MSGVTVLGAGAFGTALAVTLARKGLAVRLWTRDPASLDAIARRRESPRLPGVRLPGGVVPTADPARGEAAAVLIAVPMKALPQLLATRGADLATAPLVACCKGVDPETLQGPAGLIRAALPDARTAVLTGPSFAADIAAGLPTALTLACADDSLGEQLQDLLSTPALRLYRTTDVTGAELGGAMKNVIAIAAGVVRGAGLGESAQAALVTRGFAEMTRLATRLGADPATLSGLSGLGDLILTCGSEQSRNLRHGIAIGRGTRPDPTVTVEGVATARAIARLAPRLGIDAPISDMVDALVEGRIGLAEAISRLMSRPLKPE